MGKNKRRGGKGGGKGGPAEGQETPEPLGGAEAELPRRPPVPPLLEMPRSEATPVPAEPLPAEPVPAAPPAEPPRPAEPAVVASAYPKASPARAPASQARTVRSLMSPTASSSARSERERPSEGRPRGSPGTPARSAPVRSTPRSTPGSRTMLHSPRSVGTSRSSRSPWQPSHKATTETLKVFRPKEELEKERLSYVSSSQISPHAGSPTHWQTNLAGGRHYRSVTYDKARPEPVWSPRGSMKSIPPPAGMPKDPSLKEGPSEWRSVIRSAEDIFAEFCGDRLDGKTLSRGMSPRRAEKDFVSGLREDRPGPGPRDSWVGVRPTTPYESAAWQQVSPRALSCAGAGPSLRSDSWRPSAGSTEAAFPPPSVLTRERLKILSHKGYMSPRKSVPNWVTHLCDEKKETDHEEQEVLSQIPHLDASLLETSVATSKASLLEASVLTSPSR